MPVTVFGFNMHRFRRYIGLILTALILGVSWRCELPHQPGPMPRDILDVEFEPGLNVFGILRADGDPGSSFVHVQRAVTTEEMYEEAEIVIDNADIFVEDMSTGLELTFAMSGGSSRGGFYYAGQFQPAPGDSFRVRVSAPGFPDVFGMTIIPPKPRIVPGSLHVAGDELTFELDGNSDTFEYRVFIIGEKGALDRRYAVLDQNRVAVRISLTAELGTAQMILLYAYDRNLSEYLNNPTSFIPQSFQETVHTVEGGYGCIGSLSMETIALD